MLHLKEQNHTKKSSTTHGLLYQLFLFLFFLGNYKQKQLKNIVNRIFPITCNTLIQPVASLIQKTLHFIQYKIKPYSQLRVSMMSLTTFFTLSPTCHPNTFSLSLIGCQVMVTAFQVLSLVTRPHGSLQFPATNYHSRNS